MVQETRIFHTADTHLGYRQYHSEVRRQDFFKAFEVVIQDAFDMQVDAVVHVGDLFDSRNPKLPVHNCKNRGENSINLRDLSFN
jgi:DNA repair exonuclease SbcCD nuclease subunit